MPTAGGDTSSVGGSTRGKAVPVLPDLAGGGAGFQARFLMGIVTVAVDATSDACQWLAPFVGMVRIFL
jgi:hypothetical protein